ncbi:hypothetical protein CEXT_814351 [Caerostris extrusa]|uniref:Uncharacterized protein n=1 Tax=Caerostris extrusa TaxID=172846 RepID=A0AAV4QVE0_CAEEX|nr:hypothetical protein CEXT_814351 [Caerostris extrusa]
MKCTASSLFVLLHHWLSCRSLLPNRLLWLERKHLAMYKSRDLVHQDDPASMEYIDCQSRILWIASTHLSSSSKKPCIPHRIIAKYLLSQYILTPYNTIRLALAYVRETERAATCHQSQYEALKEGFVNFLTTLDLFTTESALMVSLVYGNEWKLAAQEYYQ